jgi:hypothetical protein
MLATQCRPPLASGALEWTYEDFTLPGIRVVALEPAIPVASSVLPVELRPRPPRYRRHPSTPIAT